MKHIICRDCGKEFLHPKQLCGRNPVRCQSCNSRPCVICNTGFKPHYPNQKCCTVACGKVLGARTKKVLGARTKSKPRIQARVFRCKGCANEFTSKRNRKDCSTVFCSRECCWAWQKASGKPKASPLMIMCPACELTFEQRRRARYCSDECRRELVRRKALERDKAKHGTKLVTCKFCNFTFMPDYGNKRRLFCSDRCHELHQRTTEQYKAAKADQNRKRRARMRGARVEKVEALVIYKRDRWRCQICGNLVNKKLKHPHPMSATLDHIITLAEGGTHEPKNVQLAHLICNSTKSGRSYGQLRLLG